MLGQNHPPLLARAKGRVGTLLLGSHSQFFAGEQMLGALQQQTRPGRGSLFTFHDGNFPGLQEGNSVKNSHVAAALVSALPSLSTGYSEANWDREEKWRGPREGPRAGSAPCSQLPGAGGGEEEPGQRGGANPHFLASLLPLLSLFSFLLHFSPPHLQ